MHFLYYSWLEQFWEVFSNVGVWMRRILIKQVNEYLSIILHVFNLFPRKIFWGISTIE